MNRYRSALAVATCAASLSVTGCTAGISTASSPPTSPAASSNGAASHGASAAASSPSPASSASMISLSGSVGSFPIPAGAKVAENAGLNGGSIVVITSVTPAKVLNFYESELPQAGYTITGNASATTAGGLEVNLLFSGHGYRGNMVAGANVPASGLDLLGVSPGHFAIITLQPT